MKKISGQQQINFYKIVALPAQKLKTNNQAFLFTYQNKEMTIEKNLTIKRLRGRKIGG